MAVKIQHINLSQTVLFVRIMISDKTLILFVAGVAVGVVATVLVKKAGLNPYTKFTPVEVIPTPIVASTPTSDIEQFLQPSAPPMQMTRIYSRATCYP